MKLASVLVLSGLLLPAIAMTGTRVAKGHAAASKLQSTKLQFTFRRGEKSQFGRKGLRVGPSQ
jgi:hypothetical protein